MKSKENIFPEGTTFEQFVSIICQKEKLMKIEINHSALKIFYENINKESVKN